MFCVIKRWLHARAAAFAVRVRAGLSAHANLSTQAELSDHTSLSSRAGLSSQTGLSSQVSLPIQARSVAGLFINPRIKASRQAGALWGCVFSLAVGLFVPLSAPLYAGQTASSAEAVAGANNVVFDQPVRLRGARYEEYTRLVLDFPQEVVYDVERTPNELVVRLEARFQIDAAPVAGKDLGLIALPIFTPAVESDAVTIMRMPLSSLASVEDFTSGTFLVLDIFGIDGRSPLASGNAPAGDDVDLDRLADNLRSQEGSADGQAGGQPSPGGVRPDSFAFASDAETYSRDGITFVILGDEGRSEEDLAVSADAVSVPNGVELRFEMPSPAAAAVFERGSVVWVVFDRAFQFNGDMLRERTNLLSDRLRSISVVPHSDALVLRIDQLVSQATSVDKDGTVWTVSFKDIRTQPRLPLSPTRRISGGGGQQIYIPANDVGRKLEVEDPVVGDVFTIMPMDRAGQGLATPYEYSIAELPATSQGVVVIPLTDETRVERFSTGIVIGSGDNVLAGFSADGQIAGDLKLVNFPEWRRGPEVDYLKNKTLALYEMSIAPESELNQARWALARFYMAYRRGAEAFGMLELMLEEEPALEKQADFLALRGMANYYLGHYEEALVDLSAEALSAEQDADVWKTMAAERAGHYSKAIAHYKIGREILGAYENEERVRFTLAAINAALHVQDYEIAGKELEYLGSLTLTKYLQPWASFYAAQYREKTGDRELALASYEALSSSFQYEVAARSRLALLNAQYEDGTIDIAAYEEGLEQLRYAWRSGQFELNILTRLADLYLEEGRFEDGLVRLRLASNLFPDEARELRLNLKMQTVFRDLFLGQDAEKLTPFKAISLFRRFQEFTPPGVDGDTMIRRLSDRLVAVDLLPQAADLLDYQVRERLEGIARAQIASNLAKIYILDQQGEKALEILRATREPLLPDDVLRERSHVEARALAELGRYEEAEILIDSDRSFEAEKIRADILWGAREYARIIPSLERLLGDGWRRGISLDERGRYNLMRLTLAQTFLQDSQALSELRQKYGREMQDGDFSTSFQLLTNAEELSGRELGVIAEQIASVEKLQSFLRDYRSDFNG